MKKHLPLIGSCILLLLASCSTEELTPLDDSSSDLTSELADRTRLLSIQEINEFIDNSFETKGYFDWSEATTRVLWSAAVHGEEMLTIGYGPEGASFRERGSNQYADIKDNIIDVISNTSGTSRKSLKVLEDDTFNYIDVEVTSYVTVEALRKVDNIRYLEPNAYSFYEIKTKEGPTQRSAGCDMSASNLNSNDFSIVSPGAYVSWTFDRHNIPQAWAQSTGQGITVGVIDTGISPNQPKLNNEFNTDGSVSSRTVEKYGTYIDSPWWWSNNIDGPDDRCGHGTSMTATVAAPRNNDQQALGVAYNCNLISYRGTADVVLNDYHERKGVSNALKALANRSDVKIISMSIGYPWGIGNVRDAVRYAHNRGKLIFAAGGTSTALTNWYPVIFPANMSECVAVTGVRDLSNGSYDQCNNCHDGSQIEFTVIMERQNDTSRMGVTLGFYAGDNAYIGGSSVATATTAGIAALVWSVHPGWSREQVLQKMRQSAELYNNPSNNYGYGNIDALQAVQ
ncbi:S8 family serine peptidase [Aureisphaera galaxeae]|uniref:S8 family peptidase n=1 Tax=Aureisphaera galaxeae TaxID=1538023 RepID=UPI00234FDCCA|nr:S8 family serine peptidase [Aureisphaera galaxeae]MDC8002686.1 S8 family serine peptidase [Aureisphaera galaxeae]